MLCPLRFLSLYCFPKFMLLIMVLLYEDYVRRKLEGLRGKNTHGIFQFTMETFSIAKM